MVTLTRGPNWKRAIDSLEVIIGHALASVLKDAIKWAAGNQPELRAMWKELNR